MDLTGCPSVSIGILHEREIILQHAQGLADASECNEVNEETCYMIGSLTKAFIAASCGMLVDEGKLYWNAPLSTYIPFTQNKDPVIGKRMSLSDALSHSSGFPQIDISWYGANGEDLLGPEDLLHVTANISVFDSFRAELHYSNWPYALVGRIIEAVGEEDALDGWGGFVGKRIFKPLGMTRSACCRSEIKGGNLAEPHTVLSNRQPVRLPIPQVSHKTICGAAMAIWSNLPDMLIWARVILERLEEENSGNDTAENNQGRGVGIGEHEAVCGGMKTESQDSSKNPLRRISQITSHKFPITGDTINENTYGFGWARHEIPSSQLGWLSTNGPQKDHAIGQHSRPRLALYHGGQVTGYLNTIYLFPETKSAVVVLTNAQSAGDCSNLVAQMFVQSLFDMEPKVDFEIRAANVSAENLNQYTEMVDAFQKNRTKGTACSALGTLEGSY
jgi:CubicO group peptidase (beta-lactamase class C family)